jgi:hypothetical protein
MDPPRSTEYSNESYSIGSIGIGAGRAAQAESFSFTTIDFPGAAPGVTYADGINNAGQIAGNFRDASGTAHGFVATPVPEPDLFLLLTLGLVSFGAVILRHTKFNG